MARVLVLRPQAGGARVLVASTDLAPQLANVGEDAVTTIDLQQYTSRMCAIPGDVVALATSGGYDEQRYPRGVPVRMFARKDGASTNVFKVAPFENIGNEDVLAPTPSEDVELLMRAVIGTGDDARPTCRGTTPTPAPTPTPGPGGTPTPVPSSSPVTVSRAASTKVRRKRVKVKLSCAGPAACAGRVALSRKSAAFGSAAFALAAGETKRVVVKLSRKARRALRKVDGGLTIKVTATTADGQRVSSRTVLRR